MFSQKNQLFSRVILGIILVFCLTATGCPGTPGMTVVVPGGGEEEDPTAANAAKNLANQLNGDAAGVVTVNDTTVTVAKNFNVVSHVLSAAEAAAAAVNVGYFTVPQGVTFLIPAQMTVTVLAGGTITAPGTITVNSGGTLVTIPGSTVTVSGTLRAESGGTITAASNTVTVSGTYSPVEGSNVSGINVTGNTGGGGGGSTTTGPILLNTAVNYDSANSYAVSAVFTFDKAVTVTSPSSGTVLSNSNKTVTVTPATTTPGTTATVSLIVSANGKSTTVTKTVMSIGNNPPALPTSGTYTVVYYDAYSATSSVAGLKKDSATTWYLVSGTNRALFNAIYTPNAPGTQDAIESGKTTVAYTKEISDAVLVLFQIDFSSTPNKVNVKGTALPDSGTNINPIVIDIGLPGTVDNTGLPTFYIPYQGLGDTSGSYSNIRLRVNKGASLVILANNSGYTANNGGAGHPTAAGYFHGGTVEVMVGGKLRDGAYEGFPLGGSEAAILNRAGSYLAVGPEPGTSDASNGMADTYNKYYAGWLIGPAGSGDNAPRIVWDNAQGYIEVRPGKLAISANVTVKKTLGLIYSVWFVDGPTVTIDAKEDTLEIANNKGLFANGKDYKFYGTTTAAKIIVKSGSTLHKAFLIATDENSFPSAGFITAPNNSNITITNKGTGSGVDYTNAVRGYPDWTGYPNP
jgi:hypothetical protein